MASRLTVWATVREISAFCVESTSVEGFSASWSARITGTAVTATTGAQGGRGVPRHCDVGEFQPGAGPHLAGGACHCDVGEFPQGQSYIQAHGYVTSNNKCV